MLTMTNPLQIEGFTVYQDDQNLIDAFLESVDDRPRPVAEVDPDGNPTVVMRAPHHGASGARPRFYVLPETPTIALDHGHPIFSLIVYRQDEDRIKADAAGEDVGGGIMTFTVELTVPDDKFNTIRSKLRSQVYGSDASDPSNDVDLSYVPFLDGKVSVAVAGEEGGGQANEFVKTLVGTGKTSGVGNNRRAIMVKLTQAGAALMSQIDKLGTLPINVAYELSFEHRLLGVTMRVWCDVSSSYHLIQEVTHSTDDYSDGYLGMSDNHVRVDKITSVTETMVRSKTAGVTVIPQSSLVDNDTLASLEKLGFDLLNKELDKVLQAAPPPAELDRAYIEKYFADFSNDFNFTLDRQMVLVRDFTPSANIANVFSSGDVRQLVAFVDLRTGFFSLLRVPIRVNADFSKLPLDSVTVTATYQSQRPDGQREQRVDSFDFKDGSTIQTFVAYANSLADVAYDWSATVHYKDTPTTFTFRHSHVQDDFLVVDVGLLGMLSVDIGIGLVDLKKFPGAKVSLRYHSDALGQTLEQQFILNEANEDAVWTEVIHEAPGPFEYKVDWLKADGGILQGEWQQSTAAKLRFDAPIPDRMEVAVICTGNFKDPTDDQIAEVGVSLHYEDSDNHYAVDGHLVFSDDKQQQSWTVDLENPQVRSYKYKYSIIYKGGVVKNFPEDGSWYDGEPGFITVGEKYTLQVVVYPTLLTYGDAARLVQVDLTYDDPDNHVHQSDSLVFTKDASTPKTWRVRGVQGGPTRYRYEVSYFATDGSMATRPAVEQDAEAIILQPPLIAAPAAASASPTG